MHFGAVMLMCVVVVILNLLASSSCSQLMKSIGEKDAMLQAKREEFDSATARWEATTSADNIDRILARHGIEVSHPRPHRIIRMDANGRVIPNQRSVELALLRKRNSPVARLSVRRGGRDSRN
ncbi:MAG: hypothetical protein K6F50_01360 [Kiritimatiellae bacterium]|nr:hypothetical protein [Kiritimatiellia bacterium]